MGSKFKNVSFRVSEEDVKIIEFIENQTNIKESITKVIAEYVRDNGTIDISPERDEVPTVSEMKPVVLNLLLENEHRAVSTVEIRQRIIEYFNLSESAQKTKRGDTVVLINNQGWTREALKNEELATFPARSMAQITELGKAMAIRPEMDIKAAAKAYSVRMMMVQEGN